MALVTKLLRHHEIVLTLEEGAIGGFASFVQMAALEAGLLDSSANCGKLRSLVLPDVFMEHDRPAHQYALTGLDAKAISAKVLALLS